MDFTQEDFKNLLIKISENEDKLNLLLKGWQDYSLNLLKPSMTQKENKKEMPIKLIKGNLRYREDLKVFEARITLNKTQKSIYGKNKTECIKKANTIYKEQYKKLKFNVENNEKLFKLIDFWYTNYKLPKIKASSTCAYKTAIKSYIKKDLKNKPVKNYSVLEIDNYLDSLPNTRTKETIYYTLHEFFKFLYNKEIIKNPIHDKIKKYKHKRKEGNFLTQEQRVIFLEQVKKIELKDLFIFLYYTGARKTGAVNLCFNDIDLINNKIHIKETKTDKSDRIIPLAKEIRYIFDNENINTNKKVFIFSDRKLKSNFNELEKLCGFRILLKDLRTTFATRMREKKINEEVIAKWLGHTTTNTTKKYYIKIDPTFENEQAKLISDL